MRLYLSSFRIGGCPERLVTMAGANARAGVIANALDAATADERKAAVDRELLAMAEVGFAAEEIDLRDYFADPTRVGADLRRYDVLWARGGNTFVLRYALARSGADAEVVRILDEDTAVWAGYSAGICVLAPSLRGLEIVDAPTAVSATYGEPTIWDGLGVLDYAIVPHVDSPEHFETEGCGRVADLYRETGVAHRTLRDGEVLVVDGARASIWR